MNRTTWLAAGIAACLGATPAFAQQADEHAGHHQTPPTPTSTDKTKEAQTPSKQADMDHTTMDHSQMQGMDHAKMGHADDGELPASVDPREPIPVPDAADRAAAFPAVHDHHQHGTSTHAYSLIDRLEVADADDGTALGWEGTGWIGGDIDKFWWRTEGHALDGKIERGQVEALYGRGIRAWWDVVAGVRHDFGEGPGRTWVGVGVQGLAPYKFEVSATAYVGEQGRTALVAEAEYDTLLTNRLILQWRAEANAYGKDDPVLGLGAGMSSIEAGARLRYEINRQFAPYIGIEHERTFGNTADMRRASGADVHDTRVVAGVRIWF